MRLGLLAAAWLAGVMAGLRSDAEVLPVALLLLATLPGGLILFLYRRSLWPPVLAGVLLLGLLRVEAAEGTVSPLVTEDGQTVTLQGRIADDPEATGRLVRFILAVESIDRGSGSAPLRARALAYAEPSGPLASVRAPPFFRYGDTLSLRGTLQRPKPFAEFDYPSYLANQGISGVLWSRQADLISQDSGSRWLGWVYGLRRELSRSIKDALPLPQSALAQALLLGQRGRLPDGLVEDFRETGLAHLLAISGLHVGIVLAMSAAASGWLLGRRRQVYLLLPLASIWLYALVSGQPPSVMRAASMGSVFIAAMALGRPRSVLPALALSAAAMVAMDPKVLQQISFQLSFTAMAGIALALPYQERVSSTVSAAAGSGWRGGWPGYLAGRAAAGLVVAAGATLATWPLVGFNFHQVALLGIFVTLLALPALPLILLASLAAAVGGLLHPALGQIFGWTAWAPLSYLVGLVSVAPSPTVSGAWVGSGLVWAWYLALGGLLLLTAGLARGRRPAGRLGRLLWGPVAGSAFAQRPFGTGLGLAVLAVLLLCGAALVWWMVFNGPDGKLHVYFFDVGQGDSALIVTPSGRQVLVDGGPEAESAVRSLVGPLSAGDRSLDMVLVTHQDSDHSRGLLEVLDRYKVASILAGKGPPESPIHLQWKAALERNGLEETPVQAGYRVVLEPDVTLEVLGPPPELIGAPSPDPNNNSVALRLVHGGVRFLLSADIEAPAELYLVRQGAALQSEVLKVAHHGSNSSTTPLFLGRVNPTVAVISVGDGNRFGHPHPDVAARLESALGPKGVYRTDRNGTIEFISDGERLWVSTER